jgi:phosphoenolpyruvate---glycerone phosphotransferase subunit DhaL
MISKQAILAWIRNLAEIYHDNREYLTELDAAIGDADHGINMNRGFTKVIEKLTEVESKSIGDILQGVGMTLVSSVGGASGPLFGTFFLRAGMAVGNREDLDTQAVTAMFEAGLEGVIQRGRAELQDKTMVDAMQPALVAMRTAVESGKSLREALEAATTAAEKGMQATIPLKARKGRASYLGDRSIGHQDPGATSTYLLFRSATDMWADSA